MSSSVNHIQACPDYVKLRTSWEETSGSLPPSCDDYQTFIEALRIPNHDAVVLLLKNWCAGVQDINDVLAFINFLQSVMKEPCNGDAVTKDGIMLVTFKAVWHVFYSAVANFRLNPPDSSFEELIAAATGVTDVVEKCLSMFLPGIPSCQTENSLCAFVAELWSQLSGTVWINAKVVNSLPWRAIQVCLTQKLLGLWTYTQSDEILHAFLTSQLRFHETLPANWRVLQEWSAHQLSKEDFERNFEACITSLDTAKGVEKKLTSMLNVFKRTLDDFNHQVPPVNNKPKKGPNKDIPYGQLEMMNDIQSLRRVLHYLSLARCFRADSEDASSGFLHVLLIERVLQVTGESIKNTTGSPNLSVKKRKALEKANVPLETLAALRNALSHYNCFSVERKQHIEDAINVQAVLYELAKLQDVFVKALHRIEFTLFMELLGEQVQTYDKDSEEAKFLVSLQDCESFAQAVEKMRGRMSDPSVRQLHFLIQQFGIQSKVCKMEALFSSINTIDDKHGNAADIWQELPIEKQEVAKSTLSEISEMKNIQELLQDMSLSTENAKPCDDRSNSSAKTDAYNSEFIDKFIDALAHKYMSKEFYANVAQELFLGADFPVDPVVIETLLDTYGDAEFATTEDRLHALSALRLLDGVLHLRIKSADTRSNPSLNGKQCKEILDCLSDLIADAHFQPVTDSQVDVVCTYIGIDDDGVNVVMRAILQDMFESISDETDRNIYVIVENVFKTCCSATCMEQVQQTMEDAALKAARLKLTSHIKCIASKKKGILSEEEFNSCKAVVNDALTTDKLQCLHDCGNGRFRNTDLKLLKNMASPFEKLCKGLKETKSLEESVKAFKEYLAVMDMPQQEQRAALSCFRAIQQDSLESFVVQRIKFLNLLLEKYNIPIVTEPSSDACAAYKCNHYLRAAVEMLLLECLEILDNLYIPPVSQTGSQCCNFSLCGTISSANLRNYLAHGNSMLESYDSDICHHILENAIELIVNGECIMALRKLFEDADIYSFVECADAKEELHTVHVGTISPLSKRDVLVAIDALQSNPDWERIVRSYFKAAAESKKSVSSKRTNMVNTSLAFSTKLMAEDALNLMLRNHLNQFSFLVGANPLICKHLFRNSWTLLHYAMCLKQNAHEAIEILLKFDVDVNASDDKNLTPLHLALLFNSKDGVEKLLSLKHIEVDAQNVYGVTALHIASQQGSLDLAQLLLNSNANPNVQSHNKWSPLHFAVGYGHKSVVQLLLRHQANPNIIGEHKWNPLHLATYRNEVDVMEILLNHTADAYATLADDPVHAARGVVHLAASYGSPEGMQLLLDRGLNADLRCPLYKYGLERSPLHFAAIRGMEDNVKFLLSQPSVDKDRTDDQGCSAIDYAMISNNTSLVKLMLQHGCKLKLNAIIDAAAKGNMEMLQLLRERGADLNASVDGFYLLTPSIAAAMAGRLDVLKFLLETVKPDMDELMRMACMYNHRSIVQYLLEEKHFEDPSRCFNKEKATPLHMAAMYGRLALVKYLVDDRGLDIDLSDGDGNTPCMEAARRRMWAVVNYFLKHSADVSGERGGRMARIAASCGQWTLAQELFDKGASLDMQWEGSTLGDSMAVVVTAACKGHLAMLEYLIEKRHLDVQALPLHSLLVLLTTYAKQGALHYLTTKGLDLASARDENGATGLHQAALAGNVEACTFFLDDMNVLVDQGDANGCSALHYAIRGRQEHVVKYLLGRNADASMKSLEGQSPMMMALDGESYNVIECLAQHEDMLSKEFPDQEGNSLPMLLVKRVRASLPLKRFAAWLDHAGTDLSHRNIAGETVLHLAARIIHNSHDVLWLILSKARAASSDDAFAKFLNGRDSDGNSPFMLVVMLSSDFTVVKTIAMLLKYNPDLNVQNGRGQTALHLSLQRKSNDVLGALLEPLGEFQQQPGKSPQNLADPRLRDENNLTAAELAQQLGNKYCVDALLFYEHSYKLHYLKDEEEHAKAEAAKKAYYAALMKDDVLAFTFKAMARDPQRTQALLEEFPSLPSLPLCRGNLAIHLAAEGGSVDVLKCLISAGSDAGAVNDLGQTALHCAATSGHVPAVDYLMNTVGLDCHQFDKEGSKPVHCAARFGKVEVLRHLFQKGLSDVNDLDENDESLLQIASAAGCDQVIEFLLTMYDADAAPLGNCAVLNEAVCNDYLSTVELLLSKGALADITRAGVSGKKSPVYLAIQNEFWSIAELLLKSATQDQLRFFLDDNAAALLVAAAGSCQLDVVKLLVERAGLDPNAPTERGQTPLMSACCLGKTKVVEYLLSKNASPNAFHHVTRMTALHTAAKFGRVEAAQILMDYHADVFALDYHPVTPVHTAIEFGRWDLAVVILDRAGPSARELFKALPLLHQEELQRHAKAKGISMDFLG